MNSISTAGAGLSSPFPPGPGQVVTLALKHRPVQGRVVWVDGNSYGLRFDQRLLASDIDDLLPIAA